MPTEAGVFLESIPRRHMPHAVAVHPAQVTHLLLERGGPRVRIVIRRKQQRMPALDADVFVTAVAIGELLVVVRAEKAGQRMAHPGDRPVLGEVRRAAPAAPVAVSGLLEHVVVHLVAPKSAR